jgi:hypothetical protein
MSPTPGALLIEERGPVDRGAALGDDDLLLFITFDILRDNRFVIQTSEPPEKSRTALSCASAPPSLGWVRKTTFERIRVLSTFVSIRLGSGA